MLTFSLNSTNVHNITIIDTNLRYTRFEKLIGSTNIVIFEIYDDIY